MLVNARFQNHAGRDRIIEGALCWDRDNTIWIQDEHKWTGRGTLCTEIPPRRNQAMVISFVPHTCSFIRSFVSTAILIIIYWVSPREQKLKMRILSFFQSYSHHTQTILLAEEVSTFSAELTAEVWGKAACWHLAFPSDSRQENPKNWFSSPSATQGLRPQGQERGETDNLFSYTQLLCDTELTLFPRKSISTFTNCESRFLHNGVISNHMNFPP